MSAESKPSGRVDAAIGGAAILMVLCCAVGPALIGAAAGSIIGGWLGIACAVILAGAGGLFLHRRGRSKRC
jgi:hypothetical protein